MSKKFTSHYVSINSKFFDYFEDLPALFTSHYVSINSLADTEAIDINIDYLHPTMYLLIQQS